MDVSEDIEECLNIKIEMEEIENRSDESLQPFVKKEYEVKENFQGKNLSWFTYFYVWKGKCELERVLSPRWRPFLALARF